MDEGGGRAGDGVARVLAGKKGSELVAADTGEEGVAREDRGEAIGEDADQFVATAMADRVVDALEAVDVEIDDTDLAGAARLDHRRGFE
jgi:hypothetical protein